MTDCLPDDLGWTVSRSTVSDHTPSAASCSQQHQAGELAAWWMAWLGRWRGKIMQVWATAKMLYKIDRRLGDVACAVLHFHWIVTVKYSKDTYCILWSRHDCLEISPMYLDIGVQYSVEALEVCHIEHCQQRPAIIGSCKQMLARFTLKVSYLGGKSPQTLFLPVVMRPSQE